MKKITISFIYLCMMLLLFGCSKSNKYLLANEYFLYHYLGSIEKYNTNDKTSLIEFEMLLDYSSKSDEDLDSKFNITYYLIPNNYLIVRDNGFSFETKEKFSLTTINTSFRERYVVSVKKDNTTYLSIDEGIENLKRYLDEVKHND